MPHSQRIQAVAGIMRLRHPPARRWRRHTTPQAHRRAAPAPQQHTKAGRQAGGQTGRRTSHAKVGLQAGLRAALRPQVGEGAVFVFGSQSPQNLRADSGHSVVGRGAEAAAGFRVTRSAQGCPIRVAQKRISQSAAPSSAAPPVASPLCTTHTHAPAGRPRAPRPSSPGCAAGRRGGTAAWA